MKKLILFLLIFFSLAFNNCFSQWNPFSDPVRLTSGNNDINPSFSNSRDNSAYPGYDWEFMVFERISGSTSNICVTKISDAGSFGGEYYVSNDPYNNKNPSIAYNRSSYEIGPEIKYAVIVWQSDKFGRQSIFASRYFTGTGWSVPFIVDSSNAENVMPKVCQIDSVNYSIVYQSGNDIIYKKYNILSDIFSLNGNITLPVSNDCSNPNVKSIKYLNGSGRVTVSFEKKIAAGHNSIYLAQGSEDSIPVLHSADSVAYEGNNHNIGFGNDKLHLESLFESDRNGTNINIFGTNVVIHHQEIIIGDSVNDCLNYTGGDFFITDYGYSENMVYSYNIRTPAELRIKFNLLNSYSVTHKISSDRFYHTSLSMNGSVSIPNTSCEKRWFVYNKDSSDNNYPSVIYGVSFTNCLSPVNLNENILPDKFTLKQNYPNPFNPVTNLEFGISKPEFVTLKVYDVLGNEIKILVNENKPAGSYEVEFNGEGLSSGIYYYSLLVNGVVADTKKMILLR